MAGKKKRSVYRKSKKGRQFTGLQRYANKTKTQENVLINEGHLILSEDSSGRNGLMSDLTIKCNICSESTSCGTSLSVSERGKSYDVNRRAVYHSLETGSGYEGLVTFCSIMNMPCLSLPFYHKMVDTILVAVEAKAQEEMQLAGFIFSVIQLL
ncbi:Hypothetical predicted protein [Paramuricea clavata]|uniref:Mutator-like transposase domain-containing protein n=1 Tax=Paramuricea clavata TaxID=317549 RepID=A0A7D9JJU9_PARCT|nr:Hypothetical predicted protein [Paramuricea clavata]